MMTRVDNKYPDNDNKNVQQLKKLNKRESLASLNNNQVDGKEFIFCAMQWFTVLPHLGYGRHPSSPFFPLLRGERHCFPSYVYLGF